MSQLSDPTGVYVRAWTTRKGRKPLSRKAKTHVPPIELILVLDTETTTDPTQRLLFGSARLYRVYYTSNHVELTLRDEWLFYADDLPERNPDGYQVLKAYSADHHLKLLSRDDFAETVIWRAVYKTRVTVVGFNLPFDLSRIALGCSEARLDPGFSLKIWGG